MTKEEVDLSTVEVVPRLPAWFGVNRGHELPEDLTGAVIVRIGAVSVEQAVEGGGLVIDYRPSASEEIKRVVFAFNELGMWVRYSGPALSPDTTGAEV
jgi:hypothetical protein